MWQESQFSPCSTLGNVNQVSSQAQCYCASSTVFLSFRSAVLGVCCLLSLDHSTPMSFQLDLWAD